MRNQLAEHLKLAAMDAVRCTLARVCKRSPGSELWLAGAGVDVDRVRRERL